MMAALSITIYYNKIYSYYLRSSGIDKINMNNSLAKLALYHS